MTYDYTTLGEARDPEEFGGKVTVRGLHHPATDDGAAAQYEVVIEGSAQFDLADPAQRAQIEQLVRALGVALGHGECTGWMGSPAAEVTPHPLRVDWSHRTADGGRLTKVKGA